MLKTSTPSATSLPTTSATGSHTAPAPKKSTLDFIRSFARAYVAPSTAEAAIMPGLVLN